jgi:copper transport protein
LALALLCTPIGASMAFAHASLVRADPANGAVLPRAPPALVLTFNEPISPLVMRLLGPDGAPIALGSVGAENATITIPAPPTLTRGSYVLSWRVVSADGHPVGGTVLFSIGAPGAKPDVVGDADESVRALLWATKFALYVGLFVGVGGAFFRAWISDGASRATTPMLAALLVGLAASVLAVGLQGLDAMALPIGALGDPMVWRTGAATSFGLTALVAGLALLAGVGSIAARSRPLARGLSAFALFGVGLAPALSGHASTAAPQLVNRSAVWVHAVCVAFWVGALLPLYAEVRGSPATGGALARFSRVIPILLVLLIASGAWLAVVQLGRLDALWTTGYGEVLACKLVAVAGLLGLAAINRYRLVPKLEREGALRPLARSLVFELALALTILGLVATWRFTPPPRTIAPHVPISLHLHGEKAMAQIEIAWPSAAQARADVLVLDGAFQPLAVKEVTLVLANPAAGIEPIRRVAAPADGGWRIDDLSVPLAGQWTLRVELLVSDFDKLTIEDTVTLPRLP